MADENRGTVQQAAGRWDLLNDDYDPHKLMRVYDDQALGYDQDSKLLSWDGPVLAAQLINQYYTNKSISILDVCAGTGLVAKELDKYGFKNIDFFDGSSGMARIAMEQNLYGRYVCQVIENDEPTVFRDNLYDAAVMSGGHKIREFAEEMLRVTKPAIVLKNEKDEEELKNAVDCLLNHEKNNKCKLIAQNKIDKIATDPNGDHPGVVLIFQKI